MRLMYAFVWNPECMCVHACALRFCLLPQQQGQNASDRSPGEQLQMNKRLGPRFQAVLYGSWASSLAMVDSSLDITILESHAMFPDGYHSKPFKDRDINVKKSFAKKLEEVCAGKDWCCCAV